MSVDIEIIAGIHFREIHIGVVIVVALGIQKLLRYKAPAAVIERSRKPLVLCCQIEVAAKRTHDVAVACHRTGKAFQLFARGNNVDNAAYTLGIVAGRRVGNHLYIFHAVGRHTLHHLFEVVLHHNRLLAVDQHLEVGRPVKLYIVLGVDRHHRHLAHHIYEHLVVGLGVGTYVVCNFLGIAFYDGFLGLDNHLFQLGIGGKRQYTQVAGCSSRHRNLAVERSVTDRSHRKDILLTPVEFYCEGTIGIGSHAAHHFVALRCTRSGIGNCLTCHIGDYTFHFTHLLCSGIRHAT